MDRMRSRRKEEVINRRESRRVERRFVRFLVAFLLLVAFLQVMLRFDGARRYLNRAIRLEGLPLERQVEGLAVPANPWLDLVPGGVETGTIYLRLLRRPKGEVWVLINQRAVKLLDKEGGPVTVRPDDFVEVLCTSGDVRVLVSAASSNVEFPGMGVFVSGKGTVLVGRVRFR